MQLEEDLVAIKETLTKIPIPSHESTSFNTLGPVDILSVDSSLASAKMDL